MFKRIPGTKIMHAEHGQKQGAKISKGVRASYSSFVKIYKSAYFGYRRSLN